MIYNAFLGNLAYPTPYRGSRFFLIYPCFSLHDYTGITRRIAVGIFRFLMLSLA